MSDPTSAQEEAAADAMLDAQIDEWYAQFLVPVNRPDLSETPDPEPPENRDWLEHPDIFDVISTHLGGRT